MKSLFIFLLTMLVISAPAHAYQRAILVGEHVNGQTRFCIYLDNSGNRFSVSISSYRPCAQTITHR